MSIKFKENDVVLLKDGRECTAVSYHEGSDIFDGEFRIDLPDDNYDWELEYGISINEIVKVIYVA